MQIAKRPSIPAQFVAPFIRLKDVAVHGTEIGKLSVCGRAGMFAAAELSPKILVQVGLVVLLAGEQTAPFMQVTTPFSLLIITGTQMSWIWKLVG